MKWKETGVGMGLGMLAVLMVGLALYHPAYGVRVWLFVFGVVYDQFVSWLHRVGREKGVTAFLVVGGTTVTLGGAGLLFGWEWMWKFGELFIYTGLPMIVGSWKRYTDERKRDEEEARAIARMGLGNDDVPPEA